MNSSQIAPRTTPSSRGNTIDPQHPVLVWLKKNNSTIWIIAAVVFGAAAYNYWSSRRVHHFNTAVWGLYNEVTQNPAESFKAANLAETFRRTREEESIHKWVVLKAIDHALSTGDQEALTALKPELDSLHQSGQLEDIVVPGSSGTQSAYDLLTAKLSAPPADFDFQNPAPTGKKFKIKLNLNQKEDFELIVGLYPEAAPEACARFQQAVEQGRLSGKFGLRAGSFGISFPGLAEEETTEETLPLEIKRGYYHTKGALSTTNSTKGMAYQSASRFELSIADAWHLDARASVFGQVLTGIEALDNLRYLGPGEPDPMDMLQVVSVEEIP